VIAFLIGHILYAAVNHIAKVEDDFRKMEELKVRAEAADVAKSQVIQLELLGFYSCCKQKVFKFILVH
jgi:hypothetical protein